MFCKWCGGDIPNGKTKCPSCNKEQPPVTECGGFYDLTPKARNASRGERDVPMKSEPTPAAPAVTAESPASRNRKKRSKKGSAAGWIALLLALILLVTMLIMQKKTAERIAKLENEISGMQKPSGTEPVATEPTDAPETTADTNRLPIDTLKDYDITVEFSCTKQEPFEVAPEGCPAKLRCSFNHTETDEKDSFTGTCYFDSTPLCEVNYDVIATASNKLDLYVYYNLPYAEKFGDYKACDEPFVILWHYSGEESDRPLADAGEMIEVTGTEQNRERTFIIHLDKVPSDAASNKIEVCFVINRANQNGHVLKFVIGTTEIDLNTGEYEFK